jgi:hypothetical protein
MTSYKTLFNESQDLAADLHREITRLKPSLREAEMEIRRLREMICLLEDSRLRSFSSIERPDLFAAVAEVFSQRNEDRNGHLPNFDEVSE